MKPAKFNAVLVSQLLQIASLAGEIEAQAQVLLESSHALVKTECMKIMPLRIVLVFII